jgi:hypothetical protein
MDSMGDLDVVELDVATSWRACDWAGVRVPEGHTVQTGYVPIHDVVVYAPYGHHLYPGEVERAYRRQLELGSDQEWPPPTGYWRDDRRFVLTDGRNRYVAALMLGIEYMLVAWLVAPKDTCARCHGTHYDGEGEPCLVCIK